MSWLARYAQDPDGCPCPGACDCADQADPQIAGALTDAHDAITPPWRRTRLAPASPGRALGPDTTSSCGATETGQRAAREGRALPATSTAEAQERQARDNTKPLSSALGEITPRGKAA